MLLLDVLISDHLSELNDTLILGADHQLLLWDKKLRDLWIYVR